MVGPASMATTRQQTAELVGQMIGCAAYAVDIFGMEIYHLLASLKIVLIL